jgi:hypothetical protein
MSSSRSVLSGVSPCWSANSYKNRLDRSNHSLSSRNRVLLFL